MAAQKGKCHVVFVPMPRPTNPEMPGAAENGQPEEANCLRTRAARNSSSAKRSRRAGQLAKPGSSARVKAVPAHKRRVGETISTGQFLPSKQDECLLKLRKLRIYDLITPP